MNGGWGNDWIGWNTWSWLQQVETALYLPHTFPGTEHLNNWPTDLHLAEKIPIHPFTWSPNSYNGVAKPFFYPLCEFIMDKIIRCQKITISRYLEYILIHSVQDSVKFVWTSWALSIFYDLVPSAFEELCRQPCPSEWKCQPTNSAYFQDSIDQVSIWYGWTKIL